MSKHDSFQSTPTPATRWPDNAHLRKQEPAPFGFDDQPKRKTGSFRLGLRNQISRKQVCLWLGRRAQP